MHKIFKAQWSSCVFTETSESPLTTATTFKTQIGLAGDLHTYHTPLFCPNVSPGSTCLNQMVHWQNLCRTFCHDEEVVGLLESAVLEQRSLKLAGGQRPSRIGAAYIWFNLWLMKFLKYPLFPYKFSFWLLVDV